ncbi:DUF2785 domain-containing protein [Holzapfeliella sp. He02]|uniref:DUF2785 domain-containing protein n=1 Tax=Holzapfeliella saturejae TaxID=3082953 RepID=A0ABU8SGB7_9LACO
MKDKITAQLLSKKLCTIKKNKQVDISDEEVNWLVQHIGDKDQKIRDGLVYQFLTLGLVSNLFTLKQHNNIHKEIIDKKLIFQNINKKSYYTLTRSFTALISGTLLYVDDDQTSIYYQKLSPKGRCYLMQSSIDYLNNEKDITGYSEKYGWVHAMAHAGDYLSATISHSQFSESWVPEVLQAIKNVVFAIKVPFIDEEEKRIAEALVQGILNHRISQSQLSEWISTFSFDLSNQSAYYQLMIFKNMLAYIYFHLRKHQFGISSKLIEGLFKVLEEY